MNMAQYIIMVNLCIIVLLGFYVIFLKKETFFQLNRAYLLCSLAASFILPIIQTGWAEQLNITRQLKYTFQAEPITIFANSPAAGNHITFSTIVLLVYLAGVAILSAILLMRLLAVRRMIVSSDTSSSYSFFKKIYLGNKSTDKLIYEHEKIHAAQWHSADIILMEIVIIFNWFNPAVYLFRKELKNVHEFIADEGALKSANSKKDYALLLLSQTFETPINNLVNTFFNQNLLKQRIMMIQKNKSPKNVLLKYLLAAPLFMLMIILSSATVNSKTSGVLANNEFPQNKQGKVYTAVDKVPSFPGGTDKFYAFLRTNIKYPAEMRQKKIEGKVFISFIVEEDGSLSNIKILKEPGYGSGKEAARVLGMSPKWVPGMQKNQKVRVAYTMPISFTLKA
ncbi:M56 family metallopeptidase [Mucilaginibacter sp. McL0603]|uniref:M56 family metallopeptidase n=1 Tax=Mucilaginibacter sp. McL0603 TaxID=3415670 RepID=UPI003CEA4730